MPGRADSVIYFFRYEEWMVASALVQQGNEGWFCIDSVLNGVWMCAAALLWWLLHQPRRLGTKGWIFK